MSQIINITITSSGPDLGPYNIFLVDDLGNVLPGPSGIPKVLLSPPGYTFTIDDNIVKVRLQSVNAGCPYTEFDVPAPSPTTTTTTLPICGCYYVLATEESLVSWVDCDGVFQQEPYSSLNPKYCTKINSILLQDPSGSIYGGTADCVDGFCPDSPCECIVVTNLNDYSININYLSCNGYFITEVAVDANDIRKLCGGYVSSSDENVYIYYSGAACTATGEGGAMACPVLSCDGESCKCTTFTCLNAGGDIVSWFDCYGKYNEHTMGPYETFSTCALNATSPTSNVIITIGTEGCIIGEKDCECQATTTTTTTTAPICNCYSVDSLVDSITSIQYNDCNGVSQNLSIPINGPSANFCAQVGTVNILPGTNTPINNGLCGTAIQCITTTTTLLIG